MTLSVTRRAGATAAAGLLATLALAGCDFRTENQNTDLGRQLPPREVSTPPAFRTDPGIQTG